jgi:hypothetical protein
LGGIRWKTEERTTVGQGAKMGTKIDFANKTKKQLEALGFEPFGDSDLMLIPSKRRKQLKGTKVVTIFGEVKLIEDAPADTRGGFLACGIYPTDAQQRLVLEDWLEKGLEEEKKHAKNKKTKANKKA